MLKRASLKIAKQSLKDDVTQTTKERKAKFNKLSNDLNFRKNLNTKTKPSNYSVPFSCWIDVKHSSIESTDSFFLDLKNEYKQIWKMSPSLKLSKKLKEEKLGQTTEEFKDDLKSLKAILNKIKELELLREQEINEIKMKQKES